MLKKSAADAKLALEKFKAPRTLNPEAIERISAGIKGFQNVEFDTPVGSIDSEELDLLALIEEAATKAGWKQLSWSGTARTISRPGGKSLIGMELSTPNVGVGVDPSNGSFLPAAVALADALRKEDIAAIGTFVALAPPGINTNPTAIHIIVGRKM